jgi:serine/threonine-protein kinase
MDISAGTVLGQKYRVDDVLGTGGMGVVVAAHDIKLDRKVAIKLLLPEALRSPEAVGRFLREARAAVKITSEHVARVIDVGELENGAPFMVMEYLQGTDLSDWLLQRGALPVEQAVTFVLQACEALAEAHSLGIVHRDLKPGNLFCIQRPDGELSIKIIDFGISKVTPPGAAPNDLTRTTSLMGSPHYMSPEQMRASKNVDARTDIWSLGVILFELVTRTTPFVGEALTDLAVKVTTEPAPRVSALLPDAPAVLEDAVARCLEKERDRRFASVGELAVALKPLGGRGAPARVERILGILRGAGVATTASPASSRREERLVGQPHAPRTVSTWSQNTPERTLRRRTVWGLAAGGALVAMGGLAWALLGGGARQAATAAPASSVPVTTTTSPEVAPLPAASTVTVAASEATAAASTTSAPRPLPAPGRSAIPRATSSQARPSAAHVPVCKLVSRFDAQGEEHFVKECR